LANAREGSTVVVSLALTGGIHALQLRLPVEAITERILRNAQKMDIDLRHLDYLVLSHGHLDHTWGLDPLIKLYTEARIAGRSCHEPKLVAHPEAFASKTLGRIGEIGSLLSIEKLSGQFQLELSRKPVWLTDRLVFLGQIERTNDYEAQHPLGKVSTPNGEADDYVVDDSALAYRSSRGLVVIVGCAHSGVCNIAEYAKKVCGDDRIIDIIGGFHLLNPDASQIKGTCAYMQKLGLEALHACHCTDLASKIALSRVAPLKEVGVGLTLAYD